ncbi:MAG TPA: PqqD family protein [Anaerolineae bacterium]|nr:PqqD family protein [Anaerolineae bacterium]
MKGEFVEPSTRLVRKSDLVFRVVNEDGIIYDPHTKQLHMLNETALLAWNLCDGEHSIADIVATIATEYEADPGEIMGDVIGFADELYQHGLLSDAA